MNVVPADRANLQAGEGLSGFGHGQPAHRLSPPIGTRVTDRHADHERDERQREADRPAGDPRHPVQAATRAALAPGMLEVALVVFQKASPIVMWNAKR